MDTRPTETADSLMVLVDVQGKLALSMFDRSRLLANLKCLLRALPAMKVPILALEQIPEKLGPTLPEVAAELKDVPVFTKRSFSACGQPEFVDALEKLGRSQVIVTGIECHVCVCQTVRDLVRAGYSVALVADAVASRTDANYRFGLEMCRDAGARLTTTEAILFELLKDVDHPAFRGVLQLVR